MVTISIVLLARWRSPPCSWDWSIYSKMNLSSSRMVWDCIFPHQSNQTRERIGWASFTEVVLELGSVFFQLCLPPLGSQLLFPNCVLLRPNSQCCSGFAVKWTRRCNIQNWRWCFMIWRIRVLRWYILSKSLFWFLGSRPLTLSLSLVLFSTQSIHSVRPLPRVVQIHTCQWRVRVSPNLFQTNHDEDCPSSWSANIGHRRGVVHGKQASIRHQVIGWSSDRWSFCVRSQGGVCWWRSVQGLHHDRIWTSIHSRQGR